MKLVANIRNYSEIIYHIFQRDNVAAKCHLFWGKWTNYSNFQQDFENTRDFRVFRTWMWSVQECLAEEVCVIFIFKRKRKYPTGFNLWCISLVAFIMYTRKYVIQLLKRPEWMASRSDGVLFRTLNIGYSRGEKWQPHYQWTFTWKRPSLLAATVRAPLGHSWIDVCTELLIVHNSYCNEISVIIHVI